MCGSRPQLAASDARDKIYGILGVTDWDITPDYTKTVREVYTEAAVSQVDEEFRKRLTSLGHFQNGSNRP